MYAVKTPYYIDIFLQAVTSCVTNSVTFASVDFVIDPISRKDIGLITYPCIIL